MRVEVDFKREKSKRGKIKEKITIKEKNNQNIVKKRGINGNKVNWLYIYMYITYRL